MALASGFLRSRRLAHVTPFLEGPLLDLGCGDCTAAELTSEYVGIDSNRNFLPVASASVAPIVQGSGHHLPFQDGAFKTVLAMAVLEHVADPIRCLREALRVLAPGGRLVMTTPTPLGDWIHHRLAYVNVTSKHAADEHQSVMAPEALCGALIEAGFVLDKHQKFLFGGNQVCVAHRPDATEQTARPFGRVAPVDDVPTDGQEAQARARAA